MQGPDFSQEGIFQLVSKTGKLHQYVLGLKRKIIILRWINKLHLML